MEQWLRQTFADSIAVDPEDGVERFAIGPKLRAGIAYFVATFGSVAAPPTLAQLKAVDADDTRGWHAIFDDWQARGLIAP